jgi:hypothetical protein
LEGWNQIKNGQYDIYNKEIKKKLAFTPVDNCAASTSAF